MGFLTSTQIWKSASTHIFNNTERDQLPECAYFQQTQAHLIIIKFLYLELQADYCNYYLGLTLEFPIIPKYEIR